MTAALAFAAAGFAVLALALLLAAHRAGRSAAERDQERKNADAVLEAQRLRDRLRSDPDFASRLRARFRR